MLETIRKIITNVLQAIYQPFLFTIILSVLILFFVMYLDKFKEGTVKDKIWAAIREWKDRFFASCQFRRGFYLAFCVVMVLFRTLLNRDMWANPISDVIGLWGFYNKNGDFTTEIVENAVLFIPLVLFLFFFQETTTKKVTGFTAVLGRALAFSFIFSFAIEMLQLFLRLGTWQLSDLFFNTLGGIIGGLIYWISAKIRKV